MNEMTIRLDKNGAAAVPGGQLLLGYAGNRGNYRLRIEQRGEWKGLTVCAHWHTPGASAAQLVENGVLEVPAAVTAVPGAGCITFEGSGRQPYRDQRRCAVQSVCQQRHGRGCTARTGYLCMGGAGKAAGRGRHFRRGKTGAAGSAAASGGGQ